jgi:hypothetical protein
MRRALSVVLVLVLALMLVSVGAVGAKAPGTGDRSGDLALFPAGGGTFSDVAWTGTVTFDGVPYGIAFFVELGPETGAVAHWTEDFVIYMSDDFTFDVTATGPVLIGVPDDPVLWAHDSGITHWKNFTWLGNGQVDEALDPFAEWQGARTHISGQFDFANLPATGTLRFN